MATILEFSPRPNRRELATTRAGGTGRQTAQILFFSGVRYCRVEDAPGKSPGDVPKRRRSKRKA